MERRAQPEVGQRVAELRKLRGLTQAGLAARLHRSTSWVTKIERGERRLDSRSALRELSDALGVSVFQLTGETDAAPDGRSRRETADLLELRRIVDRPPCGIVDTSNLRPVADLHRDAVALLERHCTVRNNFSEILPRLPGLLREAQSALAADSTEDRRRAYAASAMLYRLASIEFDHWGGDKLRARVAIDRALATATYADDPLLRASVAAMHTVQLIRQGNAAVAVAVEVADVVARDRRADTASGTVVSGALTQFAAKAAACAGDGPEARSLLKVVFSGAERLGRDRRAYGQTFGLANAASLEVCTLIDLGRPIEAARRAEGIPAGWLGKVNRIGWRYIHQARAYAMLRQDDRALTVIATGLRAAPELVRLEGTAANLVRDMLRRRKVTGERLRRIARDLHVDY